VEFENDFLAGPLCKAGLLSAKRWSTCARSADHEAGGGADHQSGERLLPAPAGVGSLPRAHAVDWRAASGVRQSADAPLIAEGSAAVGMSRLW